MPIRKATHRVAFLIGGIADSKGRPERSEGKKCLVDTFLVRGREVKMVAEWFGSEKSEVYIPAPGSHLAEVVFSWG